MIIKKTQNYLPKDYKIENEKNNSDINENKFSTTTIPNQDLRTSDFFGYDIFKRILSLFQASSAGAVDPSYIIGPNDDIIVMLW